MIRRLGRWLIEVHGVALWCPSLGIEMLEKALGWRVNPHTLGEKLHETGELRGMPCHKGRDQMTPQDWEATGAKNDMDMQLYEAGARLFLKQLERYGLKGNLTEEALRLPAELVPAAA
eukprot:scaffold2991_cov403-Prasinococcus_capsulatus_cf.AAC.2